MPRRIMLIPVGRSVGLTSVSMGLVRCLEQRAVKSHFFKPVSQPRGDFTEPDAAVSVIRHYTQVATNAPLDDRWVVKMMSSDNTDVLLEKIIADFEDQVSDSAVSVIEGLVTTQTPMPTDLTWRYREHWMPMLFLWHRLLTRRPTV